MSVTIKDENHLPQMISKLKEADGKEIKVGFLGRNKAESEAAIVAKANEFGVTIRTKKATIVIPERSFLRSTIDDPKTVDKVMDTVKRLLLRGANVKQLLNSIGISLIDAVREKLSSNIQPPNAPSTVRQKKSARTLIATGQTLKNNVKYAIS